MLDLVAAGRAVRRLGCATLGDGLLAIFGAPAAHEDDAVRAVQAGLEMIEAVAEASPALRREFGKELGESVQIRVGINTGLAIVEGMGDSARATWMRSATRSTWRHGCRPRHGRARCW